MSEPIVETHPVQTPRTATQSKAPQLVTFRAYEVYCKVFSPQPAMVTGWCRGGFSTGELIAFLYAHSFPEHEWGQHVDEAFKGMEGL